MKLALCLFLLLGFVNDVEGRTNKYCGNKHASTQFIIGGEEVPPHWWPWIVSIRSWSDRRHFCGGVLIHEKLVLTAAHCVFEHKDDTRKLRDARNLFVATGDHKMRRKDAGEKWLRVKKIHVHNKWKREEVNNFNYDLSIIELKGHNGNETVARPVCVPDYHYDPREPKQGWGCIVAGWGDTEEDIESDTLRHAEIPISSQSRCEKSWGKRYIHKSMFCGGRVYRRNIKFADGPCPGDSGGPLICSKDSDVWYVMGVISWGSIQCMRNRPAVFSNVPTMSSWIKKIVKDQGYKMDPPPPTPMSPPRRVTARPRPAARSRCRFEGFSQLRIIARLVVNGEKPKNYRHSGKSARDCIKYCMRERCNDCNGVQYYPRKRLCLLLSEGLCQASNEKLTFKSRERIIYIGKSCDDV